jgi:hypothetical protein
MLDPVSNMIRLGERTQSLLDHAAGGRLSGRDFLAVASAAGPSGGISGAMLHETLVANETQTHCRHGQRRLPQGLWPMAQNVAGQKPERVG